MTTWSRMQTEGRTFSLSLNGARSPNPKFLFFLPITADHCPSGSNCLRPARVPLESSSDLVFFQGSMLWAKMVRILWVCTSSAEGFAWSFSNACAWSSGRLRKTCRRFVHFVGGNQSKVAASLLRAQAFCILNGCASAEGRAQV